jgi:hypothetical protein
LIKVRKRGSSGKVRTGEGIGKQRREREGG